MSKTQSVADYQGDGVTTSFTLPSGSFTNFKHLLVYVDGLFVKQVGNLATTISISPAPVLNADIKVLGAVDYSPEGNLVTDATGTILGFYNPKDGTTLAMGGTGLIAKANSTMNVVPFGVAQLIDAADTGKYSTEIAAFGYGTNLRRLQESGSICRASVNVDGTGASTTGRLYMAYYAQRVDQFSGSGAGEERGNFIIIQTATISPTGVISAWTECGYIIPEQTTPLLYRCMTPIVFIHPEDNALWVTWGQADEASGYPETPQTWAAKAYMPMNGATRHSWTKPFKLGYGIVNEQPKMIGGKFIINMSAPTTFKGIPPYVAGFNLLQLTNDELVSVIHKPYSDFDFSTFGSLASEMTMVELGGVGYLSMRFNNGHQVFKVDVNAKTITYHAPLVNLSGLAGSVAVSKFCLVKINATTAAIILNWNTAARSRMNILLTTDFVTFDRRYEFDTSSGGVVAYPNACMDAVSSNLLVVYDKDRLNTSTNGGVYLLKLPLADLLAGTSSATPSRITFGNG